MAGEWVQGGIVVDPKVHQWVRDTEMENPIFQIPNFLLCENRNGWWVVYTHSTIDYSMYPFALKITDYCKITKLYDLYFGGIDTHIIHSLDAIQLQFFGLCSNETNL